MTPLYASNPEHESLGGIDRPEVLISQRQNTVHSLGINTLQHYRPTVSVVPETAPVSAPGAVIDAETRAEVTLLSDRREQTALSQIHDALNLAYEQGEGNPLYDQKAA